VAPYLLPFIATNAFTDVQFSVAPANAELAEVLEGVGASVDNDSEIDFESRIRAENPFNVIVPEVAAGGFPMAGQFISTILCVGHIKSTKGNHEPFFKAFENSPKWLAMRD
jgi:hypothetical protein